MEALPLEPLRGWEEGRRKGGRFRTLRFEVKVLDIQKAPST